MTITTAERDKYADLWASVEAYAQHSPGEQYVRMFADFAAKGSTVLDAGCGSGKGALALQAAGYTVTLCDLTRAGLQPDAVKLPFFEACLWREIPKRLPLRSRWDYAYCCDVLEHVPVQFTMLAVDQLLRVVRKGVFLSISLVPDSFGVHVGTPLHQTVQSFVWWRDALRELGDVVDARDLLITAIFLVKPRC